jgi:hypothetical protein
MADAEPAAEAIVDQQPAGAEAVVDEREVNAGEVNDVAGSAAAATQGRITFFSVSSTSLSSLSGKLPLLFSCRLHLSHLCLANCHFSSLCPLHLSLVAVWQTAIVILCVLSISLSSLSGELPFFFSVSSPSLSRRCLANCHFSSLCPLHLSLSRRCLANCHFSSLCPLHLSLVAVWQTDYRSRIQRLPCYSPSWRCM